MKGKSYEPYVPPGRSVPELTIKALLFGGLMAVILGAANAYLGMKVGLTVSATFPAAVVAMAVLRPFQGTILEENLTRTAASVGEALVAGAIFTIPAFVIAGVWEGIDLFESALIMLVGGVLGVLFVIFLRRTLVVEADLPFPESMAAAEITKAGQKGQTGAKYVFSAMGVAGLWEIFINSRGVTLVADTVSRFVPFASSRIDLGGRSREFSGGLLLESPAAQPPLIGIGFIVGAKISCVVFAGAVLGHLVLVPLGMYLQPELSAALAGRSDWSNLAGEIWQRQVRPLAVGTMIVAAFHTLYQLRTQLVSGISQGLRDIRRTAGGAGAVLRTEHDLDLKKVGAAILVLSGALFFLYQYFTHSFAGSLTLTVVMVLLGFLFAAVAGYLAGLIGGSNSPISGMTLSTLLIAALLMVVLGVTGQAGVAGVLAVAGVICCVCGIAGDMIQDLKVGHVLGGTPWRMEIAEILGVIPAALILPFVLVALHNAYTIGSAELPAPQAGLMALMSQGIVRGEMAWPLVIAGMFLAAGLILIEAPSPMLIAVGMYLPFNSTASIFVGGVFKWILDRVLDRRKASDAQKLHAENTGVLLSSGMVAGGALMAVIIAFIVLFYDVTYGKSTPAGEITPTFLDSLKQSIGIAPSGWLAWIGFAFVFYALVKIPLDAALGRK